MTLIMVRIATLLVLLTQVIRPLIGQDRFTYKNRGNRNEGVKGIGVSALDLELLSFVGYRESVALDTNVALTIKFYMPRDTSLHILARELLQRRFYRMDPIQIKWGSGWQEFTPWPTSEIITPLRIRFDQIGLVGRLYNARPGSGVLVPLLVYHSKPVSQIKEYLITLKPKETLSSVKYVLLKAGSRVPLKTKTLRKTFFARETFTIVLDFSDLPAAEYRLQVRCRVRNKAGGPRRTYTFHHQPIVE